MNLERYRNDDAFTIYAECTVLYDGRASSTLERGNYLIIKKPDGSLMVHGASHIPALNYISSGATITIEGNTIIAVRKSETIKIICYDWHDALQLVDWSANKIQIRKTEAELTNQIASNPAKYFGPGTYTVEREYQTSAGPVDLLVHTDLDSVELYHEAFKIFIVEVKKRITLSSCYQIKRYHDALNKPQIVPCLAGPRISSNALKYCHENSIKFIEVEMPESHSEI